MKIIKTGLIFLFLYQLIPFMTPKEIECFIAVAEELSFRLAAERLFLSQPPLTRHIKSLEEELGILLFHRDNKRVKLTYAGKVFYDKAKDFLKNFDELRDSVKLSSQEENGTLRIDFTFFGISKKATKYIEDFKKQYPKVNLIINETPGTYNLKESLLTDKTDIAFSYGMKADTRLQSEIVEFDSVVYAIPKNNAFAGQEKIFLKDLLHEKFVFFPRHVDPLWYDAFVSKCYENGFSPNIVQHMESMWKKINLVSLGIGITLTGKNFTQLGIGNVNYVAPAEKEGLNLPVTISYKKGNDNPVLGFFLKTVNQLN